MLLEVKLKLKSPLLGNIRHAENVRRFQRIKQNGYIEISTAHWDWAFSEAVNSLKLNIDPSSIYPDEGFPPPTLSLYNRKWVSNKGGKDKQQSELFESIREGCVLTLEFATTSKKLDTTEKTREPTIQDIEKALSFIGKFFGISQFGNKFGFGRFEVLSIKEI